MNSGAVKKVLVLGIGNVLQADDGIGVHIVNEIAERSISLPDYVEVIDGGTVGADLLPYLQDREKIIIIDALKAEDRPGSIFRLKPEDLEAKGTVFSLHDLGLQEVMFFLSLLNEQPEIIIFGIVPETISTDYSLSSTVRAVIPEVIDYVLEAVGQ